MALAALSITGLSYHTKKMSRMHVLEWPVYIASRALWLMRQNVAARRKDPLDTESCDRFTRGVAHFCARPIDVRVEFFQARAAWIPWLQAIPQAMV